MKASRAILLSGLVVVSLCLATVWLSGAVERQKTEVARVTNENAELDRLRQENARLKSLDIDANELLRLRVSRPGLPRLRNELRKLLEGPATPESAPPALQEAANQQQVLQKEKQSLEAVPSRLQCIR